MSTNDDLLPRVRTFVTRSLRFPDIPDDADIFEVGGASSLFAVELVLFVEETLGRELDDEDLERRNFASIRAVNELLTRKLLASGS
jgi:methoxymalonate biosynthesis acyl carrier protein